MGSIPIRATIFMITPPIILKDKYTSVFFAAALLFLVVAFGMAYVNILDNRNLLVIHFDAYRGADFFGDRRDVADILITGAIVLSINLWLANELYFRERFLSYALTVSTFLFSVLILVAIRVIISIN